MRCCELCLHAAVCYSCALSASLCVSCLSVSLSVCVSTIKHATQFYFYTKLPTPMVDKTDEFTELLVTADSRLLSDQRFSDRCRRAPSPFVLSTAHLFGKIKKMQKIARDSFIGYVGYHRYVDKKSATDDDVMSPSDRNSLDQSFSLFIATCASSIHGIKVPPNASTAAREHHQEIISFLLQVICNILFLPLKY